MPKGVHRDGLSRRQRTISELFPERLRDGAQLALGLGEFGKRHVQRCPVCRALIEGRTCVACAAFTCTGCREWTSGNGGDGCRCYWCIQAPAAIAP